MSASRAHGPHGREDVQDLLHGRLSPGDAASVRAHFETCLECQHECVVSRRRRYSGHRWSCPAMSKPRSARN